jgi:hypothetical protein
MFLKKIFLNWLARLYCMSSNAVTNKNSLSRLSKQVYNAQKFEEFETLKEKFQIHQETMMKAAMKSIANIKSNANSICSKIGSTDFAFKDCICASCVYNTNVESILDKTKKLSDIEYNIKEIIEFLRDTREKLAVKELRLKIAQEWKLLALVLDRTFFIMIFMITFATLVILSNIKKINI